MQTSALSSCGLDAAGLPGGLRDFTYLWSECFLRGWDAQNAGEGGR